MKFKLDFSIPTAEERMEAIKSIPLETLTKTELNTVTEYVLVPSADVPVLTIPSPNDF